MNQHLKTLRTCPLFDELEESAIPAMLRCMQARIERFDKKSTILAEGDPAREIGILLSGSAQLLQLDYYGNRSIIDDISAGDVFAEAFACAEVAALPVAIIANEPCEVMLIRSQHVMHTCENSCSHHRRLIFNLMKDLASKSVLFHQKIEVTSKRTTREKLLTYLTLQAKRAGTNSFRIPFDRQALADYLEVDRSGLSAEIGKLRREGVLVSQKNQFTLL